MAERKVSGSAPVLGALLRGLLQVSAKLPLRTARGLGGLLGRVGAVLPNQFRRVSRYNLSWCLPELTPRRRRALLHRSLIATGVAVGESGAVFSWPPERLRELVTAVEGEELLHRALERGGAGPVLLLPHLGNWEMVNPFLSSLTHFVALYRRPRIAELDVLMERARQRTGCTMVPATPTGLRDLFRYVRDGSPAIILPDQEPVRRSGVFAPFFGIPALTMTLASRLVRRFESQALFLFSRRDAGGFTICIREAPEGIDDPDPIAAATALNLGVERCVRECPEQYMWSYKRFKTRPEEELYRLHVLRDPAGVKLYRRRPYAGKAAAGG